MNRDDIRSMVQDPAIGKRGFLQTFGEALQGQDQHGNKVPKIDPQRVSVRALWEGLVGPCEKTLPSYASMGAFNYVELQEQVDSTAFPSATSILIAQKVIDAYNSVPSIGDQLVQTMQSKLRSERIVGFTELEGPREVAEGQPYEESGFSEKYVTTETAKKGRILEITEEAVFLDQTGQILMRAGRLGERTRQERELVILGGVLDVGGAAGVEVAGIKFRSVYRPSGTAVAMYSTANQNFLQVNTPLVDWTDIDAALQYHAATARDDRAVAGERLPIVMNPKVLLVGRELYATAARIVAATVVRSGDITAGAGHQFEGGNPISMLAGGMAVLTSPYIDYLAGLAGSGYSDASDWFIGDPKAQFVWQEIWPLQTMRAPQNDEANFRRDIVSRTKVRYWGGIFALDTKSFVKVDG